MTGRLRVSGLASALADSADTGWMFPPAPF